MNIKILPVDKLNLENKLKSIYIKLINSESYNSFITFEEYHKIIEDNIEKQENIVYIIHSISKEISSLEKTEDKIKILNLLKEFYISSNSINELQIISLYSKYTSRILTILQNNILLKITPDNISNIFGTIVNYLFENNIKGNKEIKMIKKAFEILQGFCFYNMKQSLYDYQINGVLCLKELISNTDYYINNKKLIKNFFEKIILFLENENFEPKTILFEIFIIFMKKCEKLFEPFINMTLYKLLNYIEVNNIDLRKKIIEVFILIITEFPYDFQNIANSIINYLNIIINKNDDLYIINKCKEALSFYNNFNFYLTFDNFKKNENNGNLFKTSKSSFYKTNTKKSDSIISKSTRYTTSRKYIKDYKNKLNDFNEFHKKIWNRNNIFSYSSNYNIWKNNYNLSRALSSNFSDNNKDKALKFKMQEENKKDSIFNYNYSSLNKKKKLFENNIRLKK